MKKTNQEIFDEHVNLFDKYNWDEFFPFLMDHELKYIQSENQMEFCRQNPYAQPWKLEEILCYFLFGDLDVNSTSIVSGGLKKLYQEILSIDSEHEMIMNGSVTQKAFELLPSKQFNNSFNFEFYLVRLYNVFYCDEKMRELFKEKFGLSFETYYSIITYLFGDLHDITLNDYIRKMENCRKLLCKLNYLTITVDEYKKMQAELLKKNDYDYSFSYNYINSKPIIFFKERYIVPLPVSFLKASLINVFNEFSFHSNTNRELLGKSLENYIYRISLECLKKYDVYPEQIYNSGDKTSDTIIFSKNSVCFVESKSRDASLKYYNSFNSNEEIITSYCEAIVQVLRNFKDFSDGRISSFNKYNNINYEKMYGIITFPKLAYIMPSRILDELFSNSIYDKYGFSREYVRDHVHLVELYEYEKMLFTGFDIFKNLKIAEKKHNDDFLKLRNFTCKIRPFKNMFEETFDVILKNTQIQELLK